jgi:hypothetical protein
LGNSIERPPVESGFKTRLWKSDNNNFCCYIHYFDQNTKLEEANSMRIREQHPRRRLKQSIYIYLGKIERLPPPALGLI